MLMNFCDVSMLSEASCNTISNDGHEVTNLTNGSDEGFIAYYAVKPPIHIDLKLVCKIQLSHIVIWPSVGAQKSSGFKLSVNSSQSAGFEDVCTAFLGPSVSGIFLYRNDFDYSNVAKPSNFLERYIQLSKFRTINAVENIRISIIKTENSVPAVKRIEIWGKVSPVCDKNTKATLETLWKKRLCKPTLPSKLEISMTSNNNESNKIKEIDNGREERIKNKEFLNIPEDFLDPITCEIMLRPIVLPSGNIIDQSTLERYGKNEATWNRKLSDPFTGMPFNEHRIAIAASALKERIDKFLLVNSNVEEIKTMPRVLGSKYKRPTLSTTSVFGNLKDENQKAQLNYEGLKKRKCETVVAQRTHNLPFCMLRKQSNSLSRISRNERDKNIISNNLAMSKPWQSKADETVDYCNCCVNKILYKLPCNHIICRKMLLSSENKCLKCNASFKSNDPVRTYV